MAVLGFERYTFRCSACHETDRCLVFIKHGRETDDEPLPVHPSPPVVPATTVQREQRVRNDNAECPGGGEVEDHLELGRLLDW